MAWNEPGGGNNKPKDPWGGGDQGPPDLDEALKKLQEKLGGLFGGRGGKSGGGGGGRGRGVSAGLLGVIALIAVVVWGLMGLYQVDEQERAVVLRFGKYQETVRPGLQWNPPLIDEVIRVNTTKVRAVTFREIMLTQDENIVEVHMSVQYVIVDPTSFVL
ncbi:MAG TPA: protease modulator HflK, partial [Halieaceae bacterium]|nr:protease modulator HflK [Halieaceae bacterium]